MRKERTFMTATAQTRKVRNAALHDLDQIWGEAYDLAVTRAGWVAKRLDNGRPLTAGSPGELHALITADCATEPGPCARRPGTPGRAS
jgi:hypothetical protein